MLEFTLSVDEQAQLKAYLKDKRYPWQIMKRLEVIRLLHTGLSITLIAKQLAIRPQLARAYVSTFKKGGFSALLTLEKPGKESLLNEQKFRELESYIDLCKKSGEKCSPKQMAGFLYLQFGISINPEWLSKRIITRRHELKREPWK